MFCIPVLILQHNIMRFSCEFRFLSLSVAYYVTYFLVYFSCCLLSHDSFFLSLSLSRAHLQLCCRYLCPASPLVITFKSLHSSVLCYSPTFADFQSLAFPAPLSLPPALPAAKFIYLFWPFGRRGLEWGEDVGRPPLSLC